MLKTMTFVLATMAALLNAQDLLSELAEPAAKHKAADEALDKQKRDAVAIAAKSYVSALDSIEKSATTAGQLDLVAAVVKERESLASGALEPDFPAALPKAKLQMSRKTLLSSLERINADFAKRKKQADADYLRFLATLQTKAASNPELAKQLAAEKAALLEGGDTSSGNGSPTAQKPRGKNVVVNGDFEKILDGKPEGWINVECVKVVKENTTTFVRFDEKPINNDGTADGHSFSQRLSFPKTAKTVTVSARLRTNDCAIRSKTEPKDPQIAVTFKNQDGQSHYVIAGWNGKNGPWKTIQNEGSVPKETVEASVTIMNARCPGQIDFDDIEVTFK